MGPKLVVDDKYVAELVTEGLEVRWESSEVDGSPGEVGAYPGLEWRKVVSTAVGKAQVQAGGGSTTFHQKHQKAIPAGDKAQSLQRRAWPLRPCDQAE